MLLLLFIFSIDVDFQVRRNDEGDPMVLINYRIPYSELSFYKQDTIYTAEYLSSIVIEKGGNETSGNSRRNLVTVEEYDETLRNDRYVESELEEEISPGKYNVLFKMWDLNSNRMWKRERLVEIPEMQPIDIAVIQWLSGASRIISTEDTIHLKLNLVNSPQEKIELTYYFKSEPGSIFFRKDTLFEQETSINIDMKIPAERFPESKYSFIALLGNMDGEELRRRELDFEIRKPFFRSKRFVERAKQLIYITSYETIEKMINAPYDERRKLWEEFWDKRDPTAGEEVNEARREYYSRIDYANEHFSSGMNPGWRTDRGRIYVILGPPDRIERHPFELGSKPYQIWYYDSRGYELIFTERYVGEYELINEPGDLRW